MTAPLVLKLCVDCNASYSVISNCAWVSTRCPDCQRKFMRERDLIRKNRTRKAADYNRVEYKIVLDPDGGWGSSPSFSKIEVEKTCWFGYFAPGTVLEHKSSQGRELLEVTGGAFHRQSLNCLKKEE
jgi:hypothetical protein